MLSCVEVQWGDIVEVWYGEGVGVGGEGEKINNPSVCIMPMLH